MNCAKPIAKPMRRKTRKQAPKQAPKQAWKQAGATILGEVFKPVALRIEVGTHLPVGGLLTPAGPLRRCQLLELPPGRDRHGARGGDGWMLRLRVRGDAMRDDGIHDGDYLVLDARVGKLRDGQTVLADEAGCTVVRQVRRVPATASSAGSSSGDHAGSSSEARAGSSNEGRVGSSSDARVSGSSASPGGNLRLERLETTGEALPLLRGGRSDRIYGASDRIYGAVVGILRKELRQPASQRASQGRELSQVQPQHAGSEGPSLEPVKRLRILQRSLRAVKSTYGATRHPRLRRALRDEAALLGREMARERERLGEGVGEVVLLN